MNGRGRGLSFLEYDYYRIVIYEPYHRLTTYTVSFLNFTGDVLVSSLFGIYAKINVIITYCTVDARIVLLDVSLPQHSARSSTCRIHLLTAALRKSALRLALRLYGRGLHSRTLQA